MTQQLKPSYTVTFSNRNTVNRDHNMRNKNVTKYEKHIDPNGEHENWINENPRDAYERIFGQSVKEYNEKQKRNDRKIDDYYSKIKNSKDKNPVYEVYVTVGNKDQHPDPEVTKELLKEFLCDWKRRNPNLEVIGAYYHADEPGAPHLHIDYIPIKENKNSKRGMKLEVGADAAFKALGFKHINAHETAQIQWQNRERLYLEKMCLERGFGVIHPDRDSKRHYEKEQYISFQEHKKQMIEILKLQANQEKKAIEPIEIIEEKKKLFGDTEPKKAVFVYDEIMDILERIPKIESIRKIAQLMDQAAERMEKCENRIEDTIYDVWERLDDHLEFYKKSYEEEKEKNKLLREEHEKLKVQLERISKLKEAYPEAFEKLEKEIRKAKEIELHGSTRENPYSINEKSSKIEKERER